MAQFKFPITLWTLIPEKLFAVAFTDGDIKGAGQMKEHYQNKFSQLARNVYILEFNGEW